MDEFYVKFARSSEGKCSDLVGADYGVSLQELSRPDKCVLRRSASGGRTGNACAARHTPTLNALVYTATHQTRQDGPVFVVSGVRV